MKDSPRKSRRWLRRLAWIAFWVTLLFFAVAAIPWPLPFVRAKLEQTLSRRLGCDVKIERVTLWPLLGQITLQQVRLDFSSRAERFHFAVAADPAGIADGATEPVWSVEEAVLSVRPDQMLFRRWPVDVGIAIRNPDLVVVAIGNTGQATTRTLDLFPPFQEWGGISARPPVFRRWRLAVLSLKGGGITAVGSGGNLKSFSQIAVTYRANGQDAKARFHGEVVNTPYEDCPIEGALLRRANLWTLRLDTGANPIPPRGDMGDFIRFGDTNRVGGIHLHAQAQRRSDGPWSFRLLGRCPRVALEGVDERDVSMTLVGRLDERTSQGAVSLELASRESRVSGATDLDLTGSSDFRTTWTIERLAAGWFGVWNRHRALQWPELEGRNGRLTVAAGGRLRRTPDKTARQWPLRWVANLRARLELSGVTVVSAYLPFAIEDVRFEGEAEPNRLAIRQCSGRWARGQVSLHGEHRGPWLGQWSGTSHVAWGFTLKIEDFLTTLPVRAESALTTKTLAALARRPVMEGDLDGSGALVLGWAPSARFTHPTTRTLQGVVNIQNGRITHPVLPDVISDINGAVEISPQQLALRSIRGRTLGTRATISATVEGEPFFWNSPTAHCEILTDITIAEAIRLAPESVRPRIKAVEPRGQIASRVVLAAPLRRPFRAEDIATTGSISFHDLTFRSPFWALTGTFSDVQGRIEMADGKIRLTSATGRIDRVPFALRAEADPKANHFLARLETSTTMAGLRDAIPRALSRWQVGGGLSGWFELEASGRDLFKRMIEVRGLTSATIPNLPFQWELRGQVFPHDAQMTFESFPTSLTAINGRVSLKNFDWTFDDLTSSWGKTENCRITGGGRFRPGNWPTMTMGLEAPVLYLDEWIRPWRRSKGSRFPPRVANPVFEMTGTLRGARAFYRGHPGDNFSGRFVLTSPYTRTDTFRFTSTTVDLYGGKLTGQGLIEFKRGVSTCTLELAPRNVSLPPFLQCETGREQTFVGRLTGNGVFDWRNGNPDTLTARGHVTVSESQFYGNVFFRNLGQLIRIPFLDNVAFAAIEAPFRLANRRVTTDKFTMDGPTLSLNGSGSTGFDHSLDATMEVSFPHLPQSAWLLDLVIQAFGKVPATVFSLDLRGSWDDPQFSFRYLGAPEEELLNAFDALWGVVVPK